MSQQRRDDLPVINIDEDPFNADWAKRTWNLPYKSADDLPALRDFIQSMVMTIDEFKALPVYVWNVDKPGMEWLKDL